MYKLIYFVVLFSIICSGNSTSAPFITKCKWDDSKCLKDSTQAAIPIFAAGIPELGVEKLDPFFIKSVDGGSSGLKLNVWDVTVTGLKDCVAKKVERDISKSKLFVKLLCTADAVGKYDINGQLLVLPIEGKGDAHIVLRKLVISVGLNLIDVVGKDGKMHWGIKDWSHTYALKDKATIELDNLFNGNEVLGRAARELLASSGNEVVTEVGPPLVKAVVKKFVDNIHNFFKIVPVEDLTL